MLSKARAKFIKSLQLKKYRKQEQCFVVEGAKNMQELLISDFEVISLLVTPTYREENESLITGFKGEVIDVKSDDLLGLGDFQTNDSVLAVVKMKPNNPISIDHYEFALMLDDIRDPGNLGTIIRTCDWYGIQKIIASEETADLYNSKVINASMGSFSRVQVYYTNLPQYLTNVSVPILGTFLDGENVHEFNFGDSGIIIIGNEANGISPEVGNLSTQRITIPKFGGAESLNAGIATAIICDNLRRGNR